MKGCILWFSARWELEEFQEYLQANREGMILASRAFCKVSDDEKEQRAYQQGLIREYDDKERMEWKDKESSQTTNEYIS